MSACNAEEFNFGEQLQADQYASKKWSLYLRKCHPELLLPFKSAGDVTDKDMKEYQRGISEIGDVDKLKKQKMKIYRGEYFSSIDSDIETASMIVECN